MGKKELNEDIEEEELDGDEDDEVREWKPVEALECPWCGALMLWDHPWGECWSCGKISDIPDYPVKEEK